MNTTFHNAKIIGSGIDSEEYHRQQAKRGERDFVMSRSELCSFAECPSKWINGAFSSDTASTEWGSLIDTLVLDGGRFQQRFAKQPAEYTNEKGESKPWSGNANVCKAWKEEQSGKKIIKHSDMDEAKFAITRLRSDRELDEFIACSKSQVMVTAEYRDDETGVIVPIKILIDLVPDWNHRSFGKSLGDLKTARSAKPKEWRRQCFEHDYHIQAALYLDIYNAACPDEDRQDFRHVISENTHPFQPARRFVSQEFLELGRIAYRRALKLYCKCVHEKSWPSYDDAEGQLIPGWSCVEPEAWMVKD